MTARIPADRLFWSVIEAPGIRAGQLPDGLWPLIEDDLPIDGARVWAVGQPIGKANLAVCAVRRSDLESIDPAALTLIPDTVPGFITAEPSSFNFLIGEYEPKPIHRARVRRHLAATACTMLAACLVTVGLWRRSEAWKSEAIAAREATRSILASIAPAPGWSRDDLALELMQRRQSTPSDHVLPSDAALALAGVLSRWPTRVPARPQTISATGTAASISVTVPGDAQSFLASLIPPEGWTLEEPRLTSIDRVTRLSLELKNGVTR